MSSSAATDRADAAAPRLTRIVVASDESAWSAIGFRAGGGEIEIGTVVFELAGGGAGRRIVRCDIAGIELSPPDGTTGGEPADADGLPLAAARELPREQPAEPHPLGVTRLDHLVAFSWDLDRTVAALQGEGLELRRLREGPTPGGSARQAFFRLGETILEVAEAPAQPRADAPERAGDRPAGGEAPSGARFYGLAFAVRDIDAAAERLGALLGEVRDAVQPGRRIATLRREAGLGLPVALITEGRGAA